MKELARTIPQAINAEDLANLRADPQVAETLGGTLTREETVRLLKRWVEIWRIEGVGPWVFRDPMSERFVGYAGLVPTESNRRDELELAYALLPALWGRGLGTRMAQIALSDAAATSRPIEVVAWCLVTNAASKRVLEKLGFERDGEVIRAGSPHIAWRYPNLRALDAVPGAQ